MRPELMRYSGPVYRAVEAVVQIADALQERRCRGILAQYGLTIRRFWAYGCRAEYCFCLLGHESDEPPEGTKFFPLPIIAKTCDLVDAGYLQFD